MNERNHAERPDESLFNALGHLVFEFGMLDEIVRVAIHMHFDFQDDIPVLTAGLRFPELVDRFRALYKDFEHEDGRRGAGEICSVLMTLNDERNREMHSTWSLWADSGLPARSRTRLGKQGLSHSIESVSPDALRALAKRMQSASDKVYEMGVDAMRRRKSPRLLEVTRGPDGLEMKPSSAAG